MYTSIISVENLNENINTKNWVIIDCRFSLTDTNWGREEYQKAHIPGAFYAHLDTDLSGPIIPGKTGRHPLPDLAFISQLFSSWGVGDQTQVVAYDDKSGAIAARLWWMLRWLGHDAVAVLDGGWKKWVDAGYFQSTDLPIPAYKPFTARPQNDRLVDADFVNAIRLDNHYVLVDSRAGTRYRGEEEPIDPIAGHIPGAVNAPFVENVGKNGVLLSKEALTNRFNDLLQHRSAEQSVFYCGSGVTACHNILALHYAGLGDAKLYAGSWSDWITNLENPTS